MATQFYTYPPVSVTANNASIGLNGTTAPLYSTEVGGTNPSGNLVSLKTDSSGSLLVSLASTVTNPLPTTDAADGPVTPGTVASKSILIGGQYNTSFPTLSNTQQAAIQVDSSGRFIISPLTNASIVKAQLQDNSGNGINSTGNALNVSAVQSGNWSTRTQDGSGNLITSTTGALDVNLKTSSITLTVSGTVTANQGSANATPWNENIAQFGGSAVVTGTGASGSGIPRVTVSNDSSVGINTGSNIIGKVGIDQTTPGTTNAISIADIGSNAVLTGNGTTGTGSQRVTIASDNTPFSVNAAARTPTALTITQTSLTIGTSAVRLTVSGSAPASDRVVLAFTPDAVSTAKFYIGASTVTNTGANAGIQIVAGQTFIANNDAGDYYVIASTTSQTGYVMEQS